MTFFINLSIFLIILFLYIHITAQFKRSEDLEIYEMDYSTNSYLQEVCDIKQPVMFRFIEQIPDFFQKMNIDSLEKYADMETDVKIKESVDYYNDKIESVDFAILPLQSFISLSSSDTHSQYFTENNDEFVSESGAASIFHKCDVLLKPNMVLQTKYDIMLGSKEVYTPLRYHTFYRHFICVNSGKIIVKMTPFKSTKYLYPIYDYENYEFRSPVNVWNPQNKYLHEMDKLKFIEFDVNVGDIVYIPPYWWYSIKYVDSDTLLSGFTYNNIMNCMANSGNWIKYFLQQNNIKRKVISLDTKKVNETSVIKSSDIAPDSELETEITL